MKRTTKTEELEKLEEYLQAERELNRYLENKILWLNRQSFKKWMGGLVIGGMVGYSFTTFILPVIIQ